MAGHVFDEAVALTALGPDRYQGRTHPRYWNMVGPFGGITAATALHAVLLHPARLGEPVSLNVNYAAAVAQGPFVVTARAVRTNRSTQHWSIAFEQEDASGASGVVLTASAVTAVRRATWGANDTPMPDVPGPWDTDAPPWVAPMEWVKRYEMRQLDGPLPQRWDGAVNPADGGAASLSRLWMRDAPPRPLDFCSLTALADLFFPRIFLRRATRVAVGTVSMTVVFHADAAALAACGDSFVLGQARAHGFGQGFFDQSAHLWSDAGSLLASSLQVVYYKH